MATPALLCAALEVALNRVLRVEPAAIQCCELLKDRTLVFETRDLGWCFNVQFDPRGVRVYTDASESGDVRVRASSLRLLTLAMNNPGANHKGVPDGLEVSGDTELLQQFSELLALAGFDPEEWLAPLVGDGAAHRIGQGMHGLLGWLQTSAREFAYSGAEYLREETGDLARAADVEEWLASVENLRENLDRCEARLKRVEKRS